MKKHVLALTMTASMVALTVCGSMPGMGMIQASAIEAAKTETAKTEEAQSGDSRAEAPASVADDKVYTLKVFTSQTDQPLTTQAYTKLVDRVKGNPNGRLEIEVFPPNQLGNNEDVIERAIQGTGIAVNADTTRMGTCIKDMGILMIGRFADSHEECRKITETDTFKGWENEPASGHGTWMLAFDFYDGPKHFMASKEVRTPEDLKGLRIGTIGAGVCTESIEAVGGTPIAVTWGEVYNNIQSRALDVCETQNTSAYPSRTYEVCKHWAKTDHLQLLQVLVCGESWSRSLSKGLQKILVGTAREVEAESAADVLTEVENREKETVEAGLTIVELDVEIFRIVVEPAYERLGYTELRKQLYKEIGKAN